MTDMRKICPQGGWMCDCPKGICNAAVEQLVESLMRLPQGDHWNGVNDTPPDRMLLCEDEGCPQFDTPHVCFSTSEAAQADSLEAHSLKYQACAQIMQLSSGRFALFGAYRAGGGSGIKLLAIGEWADLESHVREYKQLADAAYARGQERTLPAKTAADYDSLFGEEN